VRVVPDKSPIDEVPFASSRRDPRVSVAPRSTPGRLLMKMRSLLGHVLLLLAPVPLIFAVAGCPGDSTSGDPQAVPTTNPPGTNPPGTGNDSGAPTADAGPGTLDPNNEASWRGYIDVGFEETPDPANTDANVGARAMLLAVPQTELEKAIHHAEFESFRASIGVGKKGTCVPSSTLYVEVPAGKPRLANAGEVTVKANGADLLKLVPDAERKLSSPGKTVPRDSFTMRLSVEYWVSDIGLPAIAPILPGATTQPAADANGDIQGVDGLGLRLLYSLAANERTRATLITTNPSGPRYTCFGADDGTIDISTAILTEFQPYNDISITFEHFLTGFFEVSGDISHDLDVTMKHGINTFMGWGSSFHFYF